MGLPKSTPSEALVADEKKCNVKESFEQAVAMSLMIELLSVVSTKTC